MRVKYLTSPQSGRTQLGLKIWQIHKNGRTLQIVKYLTSPQNDGPY